MSSDLSPKEPRSLDEFADWTDEVESRDEQVSERAIIGQLVRFTNEGQWLLPEQVQLTKPLIVVNVRRTVTKWGKDKKPVETTFLKAGEKIPDLGKRNEETPKAEWIEGYDGNPKGPWEAQHIVHMVDPTSIDQYSYPTGTTGGGIAVRELIDRIVWMRRFRGNAVYPIVQLATRFMKTRYAGRGRLRPHFEIVDWAKFDLGSGKMIPTSSAQLLAQQPAEQLPADAADKAETMGAVLRHHRSSNGRAAERQRSSGDEIPW